MSKMRLSVEDLEVQSFATADAGTGRGTVRAHEDAGEDPFGTANSCPPENTCNQTNCGGLSCEMTGCHIKTCGTSEEAAEFLGYGVQ